MLIACVILIFDFKFDSKTNDNKFWCRFKSNCKKELGIFSGPSCQAGPGAERAPGSFLVYAKRRPCLWPGVLFRSLFAGKARHCGAVKNFFQPPQEPSVLTGKNTPGHMPKESFRTYPSP